MSSNEEKNKNSKLIVIRANEYLKEIMKRDIYVGDVGTELDVYNGDNIGLCALLTVYLHYYLNEDEAPIIAGQEVHEDSQFYGFVHSIVFNYGFEVAIKARNIIKSGVTDLDNIDLLT